MAINAFYPQVDAIRINATGYRLPVPLASLNVTNVRTNAALTGVSTDANGIILEGGYDTAADAVLVGDVIEFSHATYPGKFRVTLQSTQELAYTAVENDVSAYVAENLYTAETPSETAELYFLDEGDPLAKPYKIGDVRQGVTNYIPFTTPLAKTGRFYLVSKSESETLGPTDFSQAPTITLDIPAAGVIRPLFNHFTDVTTTVAGVVTQLHLYTIPSAMLDTNGAKILSEYKGIFAANANDKRLSIFFNAVQIVSLPLYTTSDVAWEIEVLVMRVSNTVIRIQCEQVVSGEPAQANYIEVTGLNLTTTAYDLEIKGRTNTAAGDLTLKMAYGTFIPAAV